MTSFEELAGGELDDVDARVLAQVAALYDRRDPVPDGLVERIRFGITLDALHAEIAEMERGDLVGVRADTDEARTVTFTASSLTVMITIVAGGGDDLARIDGWVVPGGGVEIELRSVGEQRTAVADADGRFVFDDVPHGLAQFHLRPPSGAGPDVITPSIEI